MSMPGMWEWFIILAIVLVFFGGSRLPKLGGAIGESIKNFRKGISDSGADAKKQVDSSTASSDAKQPSDNKRDNGQA